MKLLALSRLLLLNPTAETQGSVPQLVSGTEDHNAITGNPSGQQEDVKPAETGEEITEAPITNPFSESNTATLKVDWDAIAGKKKTDEQQDNKTGEKVEAQVEVQNPETPAQTTEQQQLATQEQVDEIIQAYPEFAPFSKKMSKEAVQYVRARLAESIKLKQDLTEQSKAIDTYKAGKTVIPQSYYENPQGYVLLPEYQSAAKDYQQAAVIEQHWAKQRASILAGEEWYDLEDVLDAKGNVVSIKVNPTPQKATAMAQASVDRYWQDSRDQLRNVANSVRNIEQSFTKQVTDRHNYFKQIEADLFPAAKWENKDGTEAKVVENIKQSMRGVGMSEQNPLFSLLAKTSAQVLILKEYINSQQKQTNRVASIQADVKKAGPNGSVAGAAGSTSNGNDEDVMASFQRLKPQY